MNIQKQSSAVHLSTLDPLPCTVHPLLEVKDLRKTFGATVALDGVTFQVDQGEIFGLLGPNGAGKTTLLSIVSGLLDTTGGSVRLLGQDAIPVSKELRRQIGIVPQELALYGDLSARENLLFFGRLYGLSAPALERRVADVLDAVGLADRADEQVAAFSGGM